MAFWFESSYFSGAYVTIYISLTASVFDFSYSYAIPLTGMILSCCANLDSMFKFDLGASAVGYFYSSIISLISIYRIN
jgi:hypothetical protein